MRGETVRLPVVIEQRVPNATLPADYQMAVALLAKCERIEECIDLGDLAEHLAVAAKQSRDRRALEHATRIMHASRARVGELLLKIPGWLPGKRAFGIKGTLPNPASRVRVAKQYGLSGHDVHNAVSLAKIDPAVRNTMIQASPPASLTQLVRMGERETVERRRLARGAAYNILMNNQHGNLGHFARWHPRQNISELVAGLTRDEADIVRAAARVAIDFLDELDRRLP